MRVEFIIILFVGFVSALPLISKQNERLNLFKDSLETGEEGVRIGLVESIILEVLEDLRVLMVNGSDNFPILDPITVENIHLDLEETLNIPNSYITLNNLTMRDTSTFEMEEIAFTMTSLLLQRYKLEFNLVTPAVNIDTEGYDLSLAIFGGQVFGKGDMSVNIVKPRIKGYFIVGFRVTWDGIFMVIHECRLSLGLDAFNAKITGLFSSQDVSDFMSTYLSRLIPEMLQFFEVEITNILSTVVLLIGNIFLRDFDLSTLFPSLGEGQK